MKELSVPARVDSLDAVNDFVDAALEELACPMKALTQFHIVIDEILANISQYAYPDGEGPFGVQIKEVAQPRGIALTFIDHGVPFDPLAKPDPDVTLSAEERAIGGLGIFMVKKMMDDVQYRYEDGQNRLTVIKYL